MDKLPCPPPIPNISSDDTDSEDSFVVLGTFNDKEPDEEEMCRLSKSAEEIYRQQKELKKKIAQTQNLLKKEMSESVAQSEDMTNSTVSNDTQEKLDEVFNSNEQIKMLIDDNKQIREWCLKAKETFELHLEKFTKAKENVKELVEKNSKLENELLECKRTQEFQEKELLELKNQVIEKKSTISDKNELEIANTRVHCLETQLMNLDVDDSSDKLINNLKKQLSDKEELLDVLQEKFDKQALSLENHKKYADELIQDQKLMNDEFQKQFESLRSQLSEEKEQHVIDVKAKQKTITELEYNLKSMADPNTPRRDHEVVQKLKQQLINSQILVTQLQEKLTTNEKQIGQMNKQITELNEKFTINDEKIEMKDKEIADLKKQFENDKFAMQAQLEVYKNDFETERQAKADIKRQKDTLENDFKALQQINVEMHEEIEVFRGNIDRADTSLASAPAADNVMVCPKCSFQFSNYQALENHVYRCLNEDF